MDQKYIRARDIAQSYKGEIGTYAVISRDGESVYAQVPNLANAQTFGIMLATAYGAAAAAGMEIKSRTDDIVVNNDIGITHIKPAGNLLVIARLNGNEKEKQFFAELAGKLEDLVKLN